MSAPRVYESGDTIVVHAELPDINPRKLKVEVSGRTFIISGSLEEEREGSHEKYSERIVRHGKYKMEVRLPREVDAASARVTYKKGILDVRMRRAAEGTGSKHASIRVPY